MTSMWGNTDVASNSVLWAPGLVNQAPTRANANLAYGNTTADGLVTGETVGVYHINDTEMNLTGVYKVVSAVTNNAGSAYAPGDLLTLANTGAGDTNTFVQATLNVATTNLATITLNGVGTGGSYVPGAQLILANGVSTINAWANITSTKVRTVTATAASGSGYANGDTCRPFDGTATTNAVFTVTTGAANTSIASLALTTNGVYTVNPNLTCNLTNITGTGSGGSATITMRIAALGAITTGNRGSFTTNPTTTGATTNTSSGSGTGATVDCTIQVGDLVVVNPGLYKVSTNVTAAVLTGGTGTGVTAVLTEPLVVPEAKYAGMTGWSLRRTFTGGRAGRVQYECLVAGVGGDYSANGTSDDTALPQ
jgi:hypothetical protein